VAEIVAALDRMDRAPARAAPPPPLAVAPAAAPPAEIGDWSI